MATSKTAQCDGSVSASVEHSVKGRSLRKGKDKDCTCPICDDQILDAKGRRKGHDAIFCDGTCQTWLHRGCAGLSRRAFEAQVGSRGEFFCPTCRLNALEAVVADIKRELTAVKNASSTIVVNTGQGEESGVTDGKRLSVSRSYASAVENAAPYPPPRLSSTLSQFSPVSQLHPATNAATSVVDRRFNIIVFGVPEMPSGSSRLARHGHDFREVSSIISNLEKDSDHNSLIRDCRRVGKYDSGRSRPRPVLVILNSTADVHNILSRRRLLTSPVFIKPDLSPASRKIEAFLLKERWRLINSGNDRRCIKIRGPSIYLNGQLHGRVIETESGFSLTSKPGDSELQPFSSTHEVVAKVSQSLPPTTSSPTTSNSA